MRLDYVVLTSLLTTTLCLCIAAAPAQAVSDLNLQFHGYATQAFVYSTNNNWNTTNSTGHGSFAWTEGVGNGTARLTPRLRVGAQARFFLLGAYGPKVNFDWASVEFKVNERIGFRGGKVKSPGGLFNETQDIDPAFLWTLLPQSIYPLASRNGNLAIRGGLVFGTIPLGESLGKLEYRVFGGNRSLAADDGYFDGARSGGVTFLDGTQGSAVGGNLTWQTPVRGLVLGVADGHDELSGKVMIGPLPGRLHADPGRLVLSGRYEHDKFMVAGEYSRFPLSANIQLIGVPFPLTIKQDQRSFYVMTSYKLAAKLTGGAYYSSTIDLKQPLATYRYQKDWTLSGRYDLGSSWYLKVEQHFIDGNASGFSLSNNPEGVQETSRLSFAKLGVTF